MAGLPRETCRHPTKRQFGLKSRFSQGSANSGSVAYTTGWRVFVLESLASDRRRLSKRLSWCVMNWHLDFRRNQTIGGRTMYRQFALALVASMLAVLAMPASAGNTQVSGIGVFDTECLPPV